MPRPIPAQITVGEMDLAGTLHLPDTAPPHPAVLMIAGSGPADRDTAGFFRPIRERFNERGLAVLSWDKPGVGESGGDWRTQTIPERAVEAHTAFRWLQAETVIAGDRVGVWGHSQGGWVGPLVAAREPDVAALVIHSGTGLTPYAQDHYGMEQALRGDGASEAEVEEGRRFVDALHAAALAGMPFARFHREVQRPARGLRWQGYFGEIDATMWTFFVRNAADRFDPLATLRAVTCPVLAVFGSDDALVPAQRSVEMLGETVSVTNDDVTVQVYPGADHRLLVGTRPAHPGGYLEAMSAWLRDRLNR